MDIKPKNILMSKKYIVNDLNKNNILNEIEILEIKLSDFGESK